MFHGYKNHKMVNGPWTILNTGSTSHRRQAVPFASAEPWDAIVLPLSPLTPPWFLDVVFPYRWVPLPCCWGYCRLSLWLLCCLFFPTGHILIFGIVERKWMKETDPSSDITWQWKIKPWRWFLQKPPIPHAAWPSLRFSWWRLCVCNVVETVIWNTLEHLKPGGCWTPALIYKKKWWLFKNHSLSS